MDYGLNLLYGFDYGPSHRDQAVQRLSEFNYFNNFIFYVFIYIFVWILNLRIATVILCHLQFFKVEKLRNVQFTPLKTLFKNFNNKLAEF